MSFPCVLSTEYNERLEVSICSYLVLQALISLNLLLYACQRLAFCLLLRCRSRNSHVRNHRRDTYTLVNCYL